MYMYINVCERRSVCVCVCVCVCEGKVTAGVCARIGVWWCCDGRHHADFISVITCLSAPGGSGHQSRAVFLHTLVSCSERVLLLLLLLLLLCFFLFSCISISETTQLSPAGCTHPQQTNLTSLQLKEMT